MHATDSRSESISQTIPSLNIRSVAAFKAFTSPERISFGGSKASSRRSAARKARWKEGKRAERIENEGKANNGAFSFHAHVGGNNRRLSAHR